MLAVAQGLVQRPRLLMLDEPSAGLSPVLVDRVFVVVRRLREAGTAVLLVEQLIEKALALADRVYALARGSIVLEASDRRGRSAAPAGARLFCNRRVIRKSGCRFSDKIILNQKSGWRFRSNLIAHWVGTKTEAHLVR